MRLFLLAVLALAACGDDSEVRKDGRASQADLFPRVDLTPSGCSSSSCVGCCQNGQCQPGTAPQACGYGGITCQTCGDNDKCQAGTCVPPKCDATSCPAGCCDSKGLCKSGTADDACGSAGGTCKACDTASEACFAGACKTKGSGSWKVTLVSLVVEGTSSWGGTCGMESSCDPYVVLTVGTTNPTTATSAIKADTNNPTWSQELLNAPEADLLAKFAVEVWDDDYGPDEAIGKCELKVTSADLTAGKIVQHCGSPIGGDTKVKDVTFSFKPL